MVKPSKTTLPPSHLGVSTLSSKAWSKSSGSMDLLGSKEALVLTEGPICPTKWRFFKKHGYPNMDGLQWKIHKWTIRCLPAILGHLQSNLWHCQGSVTTVAFILCFMSASACSISRTCATKTDTKPQSDHLHSFGNIINIQNMQETYIIFIGTYWSHILINYIQTN